MATAQPSGSLAKCIAEDVRHALGEDVGSGDLTAALVPADSHAAGAVISRGDAVICGRPWFDEVFHQLDYTVLIDWQVAEGEAVSTDGVDCVLSGPTRAILTGERAALNFLQTLSATATNTRAFVDAVAGTAAKILDTRKTLPGLRMAQKYAVNAGGAENHRIGLFDGILIKENHIITAGGIDAALKAARAGISGVLIEVEVETLEQLRDALDCGAERVLLDNFSPADLVAAVKLRDQSAPDTRLEASGGVSLETVRAIADTGVDFISIGSLTKDISATDLSMRLEVL